MDIEIMDEDNYLYYCYNLQKELDWNIKHLDIPRDENGLIKGRFKVNIIWTDEE